MIVPIGLGGLGGLIVCVLFGRSAGLDGLELPFWTFPCFGRFEVFVGDLWGLDIYISWGAIRV